MVLIVRKLHANARHSGDPGSIPGLGRSPPWRRAWQPFQVFWPGESHGQRSLTGPQSIGSQRVGRSTHNAGGQESNAGKRKKKRI